MNALSRTDYQPATSRCVAISALLTMCGLGLASVSGCFNPTYPVGQGCSESDQCPPGQSCRDEMCQLDNGPPDQIDAAPDNPDASPQPPEPIAQVAVGAHHSCAVTDSGRLRCWGEADDGRLGYGNLNDVGSEPGRLPRAAGDVEVGGAVQKVALGARHTCALLVGGDVRCWGSNNFGQLGSGVLNDVVGDDEVPTERDPLILGGPVRDLVAFQHHTCAIMTNDSAIRCWGLGGPHLGLGLTGMENIGDDETAGSVDTISVPTEILALDVGEAHTCVVVPPGQATCWGSGQYGQLGLNATTDMSTLTKESVKLEGNVATVAAGAEHSCARMVNDDLYCWGRGDNGRLGLDGVANIGDDASDEHIPVSTGGQVIDFALGGSHTCAILDPGQLVCWGSGARGRLGNTQTDDVGDNESPSDRGASPVADYSRGEFVVAVAAGANHSCIIVDGGPVGAVRRVRCFGQGDSGALGYGSENDLGDDEILFMVGDVPLF